MIWIKFYQRCIEFLKSGKYAVIIIGSNDIPKGGIRLETKIEEMALNHGFDQKIIKTDKRNTEYDEGWVYIVFKEGGKLWIILF